MKWQTNAKEELLQILTNNDLTIKCAEVMYIKWCYPRYEVAEKFNLISGHNQSDLEKFLGQLDFDYGDGFQQVCGTIWFTNGVWATRVYADGHEWWEVCELPDIPEYLL